MLTSITKSTTLSLGTAVSVVALCGCTAVSGPQDEADLSVVRQAFEAWDDASDYLISRVQDGSTVRVCLTGDGVTSTTRPIYRAHITNAIMTWVAAVRPASTVPLIDEGDIVFSCGTPDVTVIWLAANGRARAGYDGEKLYAKLYANNSDEFSTVLHEFGHVFGLGDTYVEGVWTCQPGQPNSVMCSSASDVLLADDINGIQEVYCTAFASDCKRRWSAELEWCNADDAELHVGDFNGDGRDDMLCHDTVSGKKWVALATSRGTFAGTSWSASLGWCNATTTELHVGDFNGDGRDDMLCHDTASGEKWVSLASASGTFAGTTWSAPLGWCNASSSELHIGDFNGDARDDMLCHDTASGKKWVALASAGGTFTGTSWHAPIVWCNAATSELHVGDFNGDGRDDMLCHDTASGKKWVALAWPSGGFAGTSWSADLNWCAATTSELHVGDFNGDGRDDMLCHDVDSGKKWIQFATSEGKFEGTSRVWSMEWCRAAGAQLLVGSFNSGSTSDFLCHNRVSGSKYVAYQEP